MRRALFCALLSFLLAACAAHNSHRVQVDLVNDFDSLVDEAYAQLMQQWPAGEPGGSIGTLVDVEDVVVRWWPAYSETGEPVTPIEQAYMAQRVEQRLWQLMGGPPDPALPQEYVIVAKLEADLHDPGSIVYGVSCSLAWPDRPDKELARGFSRLVQAERLFCHGCNEALGGHGAHLLHSPHSGGGEAYIGVGAGFYFCSGSGGGATYTKVR